VEGKKRKKKDKKKRKTFMSFISHSVNVSSDWLQMHPC